MHFQSKFLTYTNPIVSCVKNFIPMSFSLNHTNYWIYKNISELITLNEPIRLIWIMQSVLHLLKISKSRKCFPLNLRSKLRFSSWVDMQNSFEFSRKYETMNIHTRVVLKTIMNSWSPRFFVFKNLLRSYINLYASPFMRRTKKD